MLNIPTLKQTVLAGFVVCVLAAACSSNDGRGDQFVPPDTTVAEATTTTGDAPSTSVDETSTTPTTVDDTSTTATDAPSTSVDETTTTVVEEPLNYDEIAEFIEETNPTIIVGEDVVNEDGSIGSSVPFNPLPPELLPEPVVVTVPPTTASTTTEAPSTTPTTEPATDTTTTVWREATARLPAEAPTTYLQEDPLGPSTTDGITYGASEPTRLEPGMRLVADDAWVDGAWIIGFVEFKDSADQILMFVCVEDTTQNFVVTWRVARTATEGVYLVIYARHRVNSDTYLASLRKRSRDEWEERADYDRRHFTNLIDVSECW